MPTKFQKAVQAYEASVIHAFVHAHQVLNGRPPVIRCSCGELVEFNSARRADHRVSIAIIHPVPYCVAFTDEVPVLAYLLDTLSAAHSEKPPVGRNWNKLTNVKVSGNV